MAPPMAQMHAKTKWCSINTWSGLGAFSSFGIMPSKILQIPWAIETLDKGMMVLKFLLQNSRDLSRYLAKSVDKMLL